MHKKEIRLNFLVFYRNYTSRFYKVQYKDHNDLYDLASCNMDPFEALAVYSSSTASSKMAHTSKLSKDADVAHVLKELWWLPTRLLLRLVILQSKLTSANRTGP